MAKLRNVSDAALDLRALGKTVDVDEVVEVPDDFFENHAWAETLWAVVQGPKSSSKKPTKDEE